LKVLFCTNAFEKVSNGPAKFAHLLLTEGAKVGLEIRILTEDVSFESACVYKMNLNVLKSFKPFGLLIRMWQYHQKAMKISRSYQFDILVYNNAIIGLLSCIFFRKTIGMINDDNNAFVSVTNILKNKSRPNKHLIFHYIEYLTCRFSRCIIVNSEYLKQNLINQYNCKNSLFKVMHKGIENELVNINRKDILQKKTKRSILFVKTDFIRGGLYTLIEALKGIKGHVSVTIVGPSNNFHSSLKDMLEGEFISYEIFDYLPPTAVYLKMASSEIFCVPSKLEAFGVANLEAMAFGCKIVSTAVGGIPEAVGMSPVTKLVPPDDPLKLRAALLEAFSTSIEEELYHVSDHLNRFSCSTVVSNFKKILEECF
jgi:glycosyltransferase involved in cell wall biosynthesis